MIFMMIAIFGVAFSTTDDARSESESSFIQVPNYPILQGADQEMHEDNSSAEASSFALVDGESYPDTASFVHVGESLPDDASNLQAQEEIMTPREQVQNLEDRMIIAGHITREQVQNLQDRLQQERDIETAQRITNAEHTQEEEKRYRLQQSSELHDRVRRLCAEAADGIKRICQPCAPAASNAPDAFFMSREFANLCVEAADDLKRICQPCAQAADDLKQMSSEFARLPRPHLPLQAPPGLDLMHPQNLAPVPIGTNISLEDRADIKHFGGREGIVRKIRAFESRVRQLQNIRTNRNARLRNREEQIASLQKSCQKLNRLLGLLP